MRADEGPWTLLSPTAIIKLAVGRATAEVDVGEPSEALRSVKAHTQTEIGQFLATTPPDPLAAKYAKLPPAARANAVSAETP